MCVLWGKQLKSIGNNMGKAKKEALVLKNFYLPYLFNSNPQSEEGNWLNTPLHGRQARARNRFIKLLLEKSGEADKGRIELLKKHCKRDNKKEPVMIVNEKGREAFDLSDEGWEKFNKEFAELQSEEVIFDVLPSTEGDLKEVREILYELKKPLELKESFVYDEIMTEFDKI